MKEKYDRRRNDTELNVGDQVLAFFPPLASSHVMTSWRGPFEIVEKVTPLTYRLKNITTGETYRELSNLNRLALYYPEHEPLVKRGEDAAVDIPASVEPTSTPSTRDKEEGAATDHEQDNNEENKTKSRKQNEKETKNKKRKWSGEPVDVDDDNNSGDGDGSTRENLEDDADQGAPQLEVEPITTSRRGTRSQTAKKEMEQRQAWDKKIDAAVDQALQEPLVEADMSPAEAYAGPAPVFVDGETPPIREGDMVIVKLDPSLYETFIPPAIRAQKARRGRPARAAPKRGAEREAQDLVWRVAEVLQVIPPTHGEEMAIHVHLYDTYEHHRDVGDRAYRPAYRDTKGDREVYDASFRGALAKPNHYIEFCDTLKASQLLTRPFKLRKDGRIPNQVVAQLLPYLVAYVQYRPAV